MRKNLLVKVTIVSVLMFVFVSCSSESTDGDTKAKVAIESVYKNFLGSETQCISKNIQKYEFIQCNNDLWLSGGNEEYYALNGKARTRLEKLQLQDSHFLELPSRYEVDISGINSVFDGSASADSENLIKEISEQEISQSDLNAYCSYDQATNDLTVEANHKFGEDSYNSEERASWIEPKIKELQKRYFEDQGKKYDEVFIKITSSGVHCPR